MKTILIGGYYGAKNLGDEAILESMLGELRSLRDDLSFIVTSWQPEYTGEQFGVEAIYWKDVNALLDAALRADLIILGGGGLFHDYWGLAPETYLRKSYWDLTAFGSLPLLAKLLEIPCMIYAVGVGPFESELARQHTRLAFERCQVATLRDVESLEFLKQTGFEARKDSGPVLEVAPDPVFLMTSTAKEDIQVADFLHHRQIDQDVPLVCVVLRYWDLSGRPEDWLPSIAGGLDRFLTENRQAQVILLPFQVLDATPHTNDVDVLKKLYDLMAEWPRVHLIEESVSPRFAQAVIKRCSIVLGMRLHSLIMGINVGTPIIALSYAPKVSSVMSRAGLDSFCNTSLTPRPEDLAGQLQSAWDQRQALHVKLQSLHAEWKLEARKHARLALDLLAQSRRSPLQLAQQFALERSRLVLQLDEMREQLEHEVRTLRSRLRETELPIAELKEIHGSNFWKMAKTYYRIVQDSPLQHLYGFIVTWKREGLGRALRNAALGAWHRVVNMLQTRARTRILGDIITSLNARSLKGIFVVTSAFVFDEFYNQRVINLSKFMAKDNWGVIYVAWRWDKYQPMSGIGKEVFKNIFQIPIDFFLEGDTALAKLDHPAKHFVVEFPHPEFLLAAVKLRRYGFKTLYEIIDDWEEFHKVGQAVWFNKAYEDALVVNANFLTAVSQPLVEKFSRLRSDIHLLPNGFDPALLGLDYRRVARGDFKRNDIHLGYFGHLTDSWFDWDFLLDVLDLAGEQNLDLHFHLLGYGEPNLETRLANYQDRIQLVGKVPPSGLHTYVENWDAAMIPFRPGKLGEAVDPIKIYEYLYFGLPVIVRGIPHLNDLPGVFVVSDAQQFLEVIGLLRRQEQQKRKPESLDQFTWQQRFAGLLKMLESEEWMSL